MKGANRMSFGRKKVLLITTVLMICLSLFCSFLFIAGFADHDCTHDDDCAICHAITLCINTVIGAAAENTALSAAIAALLLSIAVAVLSGTVIYTDTLVSLKVELRN